MENYFAELYDIQLKKLLEEVKNFKDEANIWRNAPGVTNSAGTLELHLLGNLNLTIGTHLGGTGYVRNREQEFSLTGVSQQKLITDIESLIEVVKNGLKDIGPKKLA